MKKPIINVSSVQMPLMSKKKKRLLSNGNVLNSLHLD
jgi:hypothetical protein